MRLIVITSDHAVNEEPQIINSLFTHGLQRLHLRKPSFTNDDYEKYLAGIDSQWHHRIVLHGGYGLYTKYNPGGLHLNSFSRDDANTWQLLKDIPPSAISTSFHSWQEIEDNTFPYGYVFISPVFDSISKTGYKAGVDLAGAKEIKQNFASQNKYYPSIIGLGGVVAEQINALHQFGFDGAAMLGAIWQAENPVAAFMEVMDRINSLQDV